MPVRSTIQAGKGSDLNATFVLHLVALSAIAALVSVNGWTAFAEANNATARVASPERIAGDPVLVAIETSTPRSAQPGG